MVLADTGEEEIVSCECGYGANSEKAEFKIWESKPNTEALETLAEVHTPGVSSVADVGKLLKMHERKFIKTMIYIADEKPVVALIRGDFEINEHKLRALLDASTVALADEATIEKVTGAPVGFAGPQGLKNVRIIADHSVKGIVNGVTGANKGDYHSTGVNPGRDFTPETYADLRFVRRGDKCAKCGKELSFHRGIEVGHAFKLGLKYSKAMKASYLDEAGKENLLVMGCYGIGVSRMVAATVEQSNDAEGIIWPVNLAPFQVSIVPVNYEDPLTRKVCDEIAGKLTEAGVDVLVDDRNERAGIKFKDSDLIGIPLRITIGEKNLKDNKVELKARRDGQKDFRLVPADSAAVETLKLLGR
jgi:prolyl-tRNA synthetase